MSESTPWLAAAFSAAATATSSVAAASTTTNAATSVAAAAPSALVSFWKALPNNAQAIGAAWVISSALCTTYSTTKFLKYEGPPQVSPALGNAPITVSKNHQTIARSHRSVASSSTQLFPVLSRPLLLSLYRFLGSFLFSLLLSPSNTAWNSFALWFEMVVTNLQQTIRCIPSFAVPAACMFLATTANSLSLERMGISLTYTSKCAIPVITVLLTLIIDGPAALPNPWALSALVPIVAGIGAASWNAPTFDPLGFAAAMSSASFQCGLSVMSKRAMARTQTSGLIAHRIMSAASLVIAMLTTVLPQVLLHWFREWKRRQEINLQSDQSNKVRPNPPTWLSLFAILSFHIEYVLSFMFVRLVPVITFGTADAMRRLAIICTGRWYFPDKNQPLTPLNVAGMAMALMGALAYAVASTMR